MLDFLKNILGQGKKKGSASLKPNEVEQFIEENAKNRVENFRQQLQKRLNSVKAEVAAGAESLAKLEKAELRNKKIEQRLISIMEGNRKAYVAKVTAFFSQVNPPDSPGPEEINNYTAKYWEQLRLMSSATAKPYYVLQEFFAHESRDVAISIKKTELLIKEIEQLNVESPLRTIKEIGSSKDRLSKHIGLQTDLTVRISELGQEISQMEETKKSIEALIAKVRGGEGFEAYNRLLKERDEADARIKKHRDELEQMFAVLERSLRKYERMTLEPKVVQEYLENPVRALKDDEDFKIIGLLQKMGQLLAGNKIEEKKKEKCIEIIGQLSTDYLSAFLIRLKELEEEKRVIQNNLSMNTVMQQLGELSYKLEHQNQKIQRADKETADTRQKLDNLKIDELKKEIEEKLAGLTGFEVQLDISE